MTPYIKYIGVLNLCLLLFSCKGIEKEVIEAYHPDGAPKVISTIEIHSGDSVKTQERHLYPNGQLKMHGGFKNGKRDGKWESFYVNGFLWSTSNYESGVRNGNSTVYYESGTPHISGQFKDDVATGIWIWYDEQGDPIRQIDYSK